MIPSIFPPPPAPSDERDGSSSVASVEDCGLQPQPFNNYETVGMRDDWQMREREADLGDVFVLCDQTVLKSHEGRLEGIYLIFLVTDLIFHLSVLRSHI